MVLILAAAGLVLLVACANAAGLAISRGAERGRELAVRAALGAGRGRLAGQLLAEGSALTVLAGVAGLGIGRAALGAIVRLAPAGVPRIETLGLGITAVAGWAAITALSGVLFAVGPALAVSRIAVGASDGLGTRSASAGRRELRPQRLLVVFQVALAVLLLAASVLLVRSYAGLRAVDPGYRIRGILTAAIAPPERGYAAEPARTEAFWRELLSRVRALPGVEAASSTYSAPLSGQEFRTTVVAEGDEEAEPLWAGSVPVRDDWFSTTGVPLLRGRDFTAADGPGAPDAAIVSETMARRLWPDSDPIGRRFRLTGGIAGALYDFDRQYFDDWLVVVGVAGDVRRTSLEAAPAPEYYRPHAQLPWPPLTLVVRTVGDPTALVGPLRDIVRRVDPEVPVQSVRTLRAQVGEALAEPRFRMLLVGAFGVVTALLAMVGLHAVTAIAVARRTREMGIRIALGATRHDIIARVLGDGLRLVAVGTAAGLAAALLVARTLASILFGISPGDPATYVAVTLATASVALLACLLPALRAGRTDPVRSIQAD